MTDRKSSHNSNELTSEDPAAELATSRTFSLSLDDHDGVPKRVAVKINEVTVEEMTTTTATIPINGPASSTINANQTSHHHVGEPLYHKKASGRSSSLQHQYSRMSSGAETSDSDQEFVKNASGGGLKKDLILSGHHDWSRSASSRSRNKLRSAEQRAMGASGVYQQSSLTNPASLSVSQESAQRPLSVSSESNHHHHYHRGGGGEFMLLNGIMESSSTASTNSAAHPNMMTRARSLAEPPTSTSSSSHKLGVAQHHHQQSATGTATPVGDVSRALSIEHRQANMSQMSISSQLSKNSSIRNHHHHHQAAMIVQQMLNNSTTPRESLVFFRSDDKPIAKILLQQNSGGTNNRSGSFSHTPGTQLIIENNNNNNNNKHDENITIINEVSNSNEQPDMGTMRKNSQSNPNELSNG